jgi:hypothetical protein
MRDRIFELVQLAKPGDHVSRAYDIFMVVVACMSILPILFHTDQLPQWAQDTISTLDVIAVYILAFDYILRWMTHDIKEGKRGNWHSFVRYPFTIGAIIDLLSILPSLNVLPEGFLFLRVLRVFRIFRYSKQLTTIANVFAQEKRTLGSVLVLAVAYIFVTALVMFTLEGETFDSFLDALYWSTITLTTIGFGDIHPLTDLGMVVTSISSVFGIFVLALPAGIMTSSFLHQLRLRSEDEEKYYSKAFIGDVQPGYFHLSPEKVKKYRKSNPKVRMYAGLIAFGVVLNFVLCAIASEVFWQPVWLDTTGTAIVAFLLEPAAGIIVGFINNLILAVYTGNAGNLLYVAESAVTALAYGFLLRRTEDGKFPVANSIKVLGIVIGAQSVISVALALLLSNGQLTTVFAQFYQQTFEGMGVTPFTSLLLAAIVERTLDALSVYFIAMLFRGFFAKPRYNPEIWLAGKMARLDHDSAGSEWHEGEGAVGDFPQAKEAESSEEGKPDLELQPGSEPEPSSGSPLIARYGNAVVADAERLRACAKELRNQADDYTGSTTSRIYEAGAAALKVIAEQDVSTPEEFQKAFELYVFRKRKNAKKNGKGSQSQESVQ